MRLRLFFLFSYFLAGLPQLYSQYIVNGSAQQNACNCYTLTQPLVNQSGSVWNSNKINLTASFDFWFNVFLGCSDAGADGMVFILQPISTSVGTNGQGMGFSGVSPSIGIALDTYQNTTLNDPAFDHISIQANGNVHHNADLAGPVSISSTSSDVEDCRWHKLRITWDAAGRWLRTYFDGVLRVEKQVDLVATIFNNDPLVYWGFTGATGGAVNLQQFCTALDPVFYSNFSNNVACHGTPVQFANASESFAPIVSYNWSFGDGTSSTTANPPAHTYAAPGDYRVTLKIKAQDGCERDSSQVITVAPIPTASLLAFDTCSGFVPRYQLSTNTSQVKYEWTINGNTITGTSLPPLNNLAAGNYGLDVLVTSNFGCGPAAKASTNFSVFPKPSVQILSADGCADELISFDAEQTDNRSLIHQWNWRINNQSRTGKSVQFRFAEAGDFPVRLWAVSDKGCVSDTALSSTKINQAFVLASDTVLLQNTSAIINVQTNGTVVWTPSIGLSNPFIVNPNVVLNADQTYTIKATTPEGCMASDTMQIKVFRGVTVYVPTAFTPNGDGLNDRLLPVYVGIKELKKFAVFNRWGERVFATADMGKGWDGQNLPGSYVWFINATDFFGKPVLLKGLVTIIR